jgi:D-alanyl-D-alanine carboxypeptidase/D-alanyl-D-alanine-endopeptidase (penicillin-binding protein 4)
MQQIGKILIGVLTLLGGFAGAAQTELPRALAGALAVRNIPPENISVYVEDLEAQKTILDFNADAPRNPASSIKILTTLAALDSLGPAYRWKTEVYFIGPLEDGVLRGDLVIKGYGDPFLVTERFWSMLRELRQKGLRRIEGNLVIDDSYFDVPAHDAGAFDNAPLRAYNVEPNALMLNLKVVNYLFSPRSEDNRVNLVVDPDLENLRIVNELKLVDGHCGGYQRGIAVTANDAADTVTFSGKFPRGCDSYRMGRTALDHNRYAYGLFKHLWAEVGGEFDGELKKGKIEDGMEPALVFDSQPLSEVITLLNKHSNNVMARQLVFTLGAETSGPPGTDKAGRQAIYDWLGRNELIFPEMILENGSGLSRESRISARHLGDLLRLGYRSRYMPEFLSSLSLSGMDGTLSRRYRGDALEGMAHAKTGSLEDVSALAGYVQTKSGRRLSVVIMLNHDDVHRGPGEEAQTALLRWLYDR